MKDSLASMAPTIFKSGSYRYFFFSREEARMHIHVISPEGEAKFWIEPIVSLANSTGLSDRELIKIEKEIKGRLHEIKKAWKKHFTSH